MTRADRPAAIEQSFITRAQQLEQRPPCQVGCPNSGDVRGWLGIIAQRGKHGMSPEQAYNKAWNRLVELNPFPATIGRICPHPCESRCTRAGKDGAVAINDLERFLGDWAIEHELALPHSPVLLAKAKPLLQLWKALPVIPMLLINSLYQ